MLHRPSVLSFDTLTAWPRPTRALVLAVALCAVFRAGLYAVADRLDRIPAPAIHEQFVERENRLIRGAREKPRIVVMGSSLLLYGLLEDQIAAAAGLPREQVVNLALESGRAWDALALIRRNPAFFDDVRLVVFDVSPSQVLQSSADRRMSHFYRFSTLPEKLAADHLSDRALLLLDWAWPYYSEHRDLATWLRGLSGNAPGDSACGLRPAWIPEKLSILMARKPKTMPVPTLAALQAAPAATSELHYRLLADFVNHWKRRGVPVLLVGWPVASFHPGLVRGEFQTPQSLAFQAYVESLTGPGVAYVRWQAGSRVGLSDATDYMDGSHLTPAGAAKMTRVVTRQLDALGWLACSGNPDPASSAGVIAHSGR